MSFRFAIYVQLFIYLQRKTPKTFNVIRDYNFFLSIIFSLTICPKGLDHFDIVTRNRTLDKTFWVYSTYQIMYAIPKLFEKKKSV